MRGISWGLAILGLLAATGLIAWYGTAHVLDAATSVGWAGFGVLIGWQGIIFILCGTAWTLLAGGPFPLWLWGRMVRDAAGNCLPLSQMGGFVAGARAVTLFGVAWTDATAATIVDVTAEVLAQIAFATIGLCILVARQPASPLAIPLAIALAVAAAAMASFIVVQQGARRIFSRLGHLIAGQWSDKAISHVDRLQDALSRLYRNRARLACTSFLHLVGWLATGVGGWLTYRLLGARLEIEDAIAIEALLHAALAVAFLVPGYAGVQEAAYAALGAIFGVAPEISLAVSLVRRARDIVVGLPILCAWQALEAHRLRRPSPAPSMSRSVPALVTDSSNKAGNTDGSILPDRQRIRTG